MKYTWSILDIRERKKAKDKEHLETKGGMKQELQEASRKHQAGKQKKAKSGVNFKPGTLGFVHIEKGLMRTNFQQYLPYN